MPERTADVAVVGGGPAGIAAAAIAAEDGATVLLVDQGRALGGQIWRHRPSEPLPAAARPWLERLRRSGVAIRLLSTVVDARPGWLLVDGPEGVAELRADRLVLATGGRELFLPFPGWTLPGVLGVAALQALIEAGGDCAGSRVVLSGSGPLLLAVARRLSRHGASVRLVTEQASAAAVWGFGLGLWRTPRTALQGLALRAASGLRYRTGCWAVEALGEDSVTAVRLTDGRRDWTEKCDLLGASYGLVPNTELARLLGCRVEGGRVVVDAEQQTSIEGVFCAGEPTGIGGAALALVEGEIAGRAAVGAVATSGSRRARRRRLLRFAATLEAAFAPRPELRDRLSAETLVCRCEDVPWSAIDPTWRARQAKLACRVGMGPCQGRICGPALGFLCGWEEGTVRPPLEPVAVAALATGSLDRSRPS